MGEKPTKKSDKTDIVVDGKHLATSKSTSEYNPMKNFMRRSSDSDRRDWSEMQAKQDKRIRDGKQRIRDRVSNLTKEELTELYVNATWK